MSEHPVNALGALYDQARGGRPVVTFIFLGLCIAITVPALVEPHLYAVFGGIAPREHPWQVFTAAFVHGWPGMPGIVHLALNTVLIVECGRPCERLLGSGRFLALGLASLAANALVQTFAEGVNGSSIVIWSWGPSLVVALAWARRRDAGVATSEPYRRLSGILVVMYVVVVGIMALLPYLGGWRGNVLVALAKANVYHFTATGVGIGFALLHVGFIRRRMAVLSAG